MMIDPLGRRITYLRLSLTDRCNLRCTYCMPERMRFVPRAELLDVDELDRLASAFIGKGVRTLRLTGGEPLVRRDLPQLVERLSRHLVSGALDELTLTTNGLLLARHAAMLAGHGVRRINVSLDSLDPARFAALTRGGDVAEVMRGIAAARAVGITVRLNAVALASTRDEWVRLADWANHHDCSIAFIEVMPMGIIDEDRADQFVPLSEVRAALAERWTLAPLALRSAGPARYVRTDAGATIGFITPLTHNFCGDCNRVRVTCTGQLFLCLGQDADADLRAPLRASADDALLDAAIDRAIARKPAAHDFTIERGAAPAVARTMSLTGG